MTPRLQKLFDSLKDLKPVERLGEMMAQLRGTSKTLKVATSEMLAGANDLANRTTR